VSVERGDDPPDYAFTVDRKKWAVEVTGLIPQIMHEGKAHSRAGIDARTVGIEEEVRRDVLRRSGGDVHGAYNLHLEAPFTKAEVREIVIRAAEYIMSKDGGSMDLLKDGNAIIERKKANGELTVGSIWSIRPFQRLADGRNSDAYDLKATLLQCLQYALGKKLPRMCKLQGYDKTVIVFWHEMSWYDQDDLETALGQVLPGQHGIDCFFYVDSDKVLQVLGAAH